MRREILTTEKIRGNKLKDQIIRRFELEKAAIFLFLLFVFLKF
jgi:hypothetical protein